MPEKFKPSQTVRDKATGKNKTQHFYMQSTPAQELVDYLDSFNAKPKIKVKVKRELVRRGYYKS
jgi:Holliday junction resolvase